MTTTYPRAQTAFSYSLMVATAFISLSATPIANAAVPTEAQWDSFNKATLEHHVIPRYALLKSASSNLSSRAKAYCADQAPATKAALEQAFVQTLNAWQGIQHVNFGPVENNMYNFSMQYWPDKKNLTSKHLNALLTAQDPETLEPDYFRGASVTVKGLPALERLIFSDQMSNPFACKLGTAIASNVAHMADDIHAGWLGFGKARFDAALSGDDYYENATEAATDLLKSLVEPIESIRDLKLLRPMNGAVDKTKPRRLESWRSRQALDNLKANIAALDNLYEGKEHEHINVKALLIGTQNPEAIKLAEELSQGFTKVNTLLGQLEAPLFETLSQPKNYQTLETLTVELKSLNNSFAIAMQLLDIQLGFNSRDGD